MSGCGADSGQGDAAGSDCSEVLHRVYEYLDGEMTPDDTVKIKHHLDECGPCLQEYDLDQALKAEKHMSSDRPGLIMRRRLLELLQAHGEAEVTNVQPA